MILHIHRKDLRTSDLRVLDYIAARGLPSLHLVILDPQLLKHGREKEHSGIAFLRAVRVLRDEYTALGRVLNLTYGEPEAIVAAMLERQRVEEVVVQQEFTPYARVRDRKLKQLAEERGVRWTTIPDGTLAEAQELHSFCGRKEPYKVFTPFYRKWSQLLGERYRPSSRISVADLHTGVADDGLLERFTPPFSLEEYKGFEETADEVLRLFVEERLAEYPVQRDLYAEEGTSGISRYLNCGALSIRHVYESLPRTQSAEAWKRQLAWRDFYVYQSQCDPLFFQYEKAYELEGLSDRYLEAWALGRTGIPIIDAAMTELRETGRMPNRLRMLTAMFLCKNLLCPFPRGEQVFRYKLADYDNTLNRGGWLWCSSLGFDAAPYFRIMNPVTQSERYDPKGTYIRKWLPELRVLSDKAVHQPQPHALVDLSRSRETAIEVYRSILRSGPKQD